MLATFIGLLTGLIVAVVAAEVYSGAGWLSSRIVRSAAKRLPGSIRAIREEEWLAELAEFDGLQLSKLFWSIGIYTAALKLKFRHALKEDIVRKALKETLVKKERQSVSEREEGGLSFQEFILKVLQSRDMTLRLIMVIVVLGIVLVPVEVITFNAMPKSAFDSEYIIGPGSTMLVMLGAGLRRIRRKRRPNGKKSIDKLLVTAARQPRSEKPSPPSKAHDFSVSRTFR